MKNVLAITLTLLVACCTPHPDATGVPQRITDAQQCLRCLRVFDRFEDIHRTQYRFPEERIRQFTIPALCNDCWRLETPAQRVGYVHERYLAWRALGYFDADDWREIKAAVLQEP